MLIMPGTVRLRVGEILNEREITVQQFAEMAGMNYKTALDIANDRYLRIGKDTLAKICDALDVVPADVLVYES